jgi:hypothetical protein
MFLYTIRRVTFATAVIMLWAAPLVSASDS